MRKYALSFSCIQILNITGTQLSDFVCTHKPAIDGIRHCTNCHHTV